MVEEPSFTESQLMIRVGQNGATDRPRRADGRASGRFDRHSEPKGHRAWMTTQSTPGADGPTNAILGQVPIEITVSVGFARPMVRDLMRLGRDAFCRWTGASTTRWNCISVTSLSRGASCRNWKAIRRAISGCA